MRKVYRCLHWFLPYFCLLILNLAACGTAGEATSRSVPTAKPVATQPVTVNLVLTHPIVYVALGASDAVGVGSSEPGSQGYVSLIASHLSKGSRLINLGVSGIRLHEALSKELPLALSTGPQLVTIWLAANDFVASVPYESYIRDLNTLLHQLRAGTHARIVMANLPDLTRLPVFGRLTGQQRMHMTAELQRWNAGIAGAAGHYAVTVVDLYSHESQLTAHPEYISDDGFHPSAAGYMQLANYFWQAINQPE